MSAIQPPPNNKPPQQVGLLGGGVIGGGWAARFVLNGTDVRLYDPAEGALERVQKIIDSARQVYRRLVDVSLPKEGNLEQVSTIAEAVAGAQLIQESAPEKLPLKREILLKASELAHPSVPICSSTSGFRPSILSQNLVHPERILIAHPFNPVYLLPLVELCGTEQVSEHFLSRLAAVYRSIGMHPLILRKEVDAFIANRLQEALWREALWLVHDGYASMQDVDDAVRYSFGLRRAVMGPFLTARITAGSAGIRRYMEQFGPMLQAPWSKLTDVPDLTESFLDGLAEGSDTQIRSEERSIEELEQKRDEGIVAVLKALRQENYGAGATLARWEQTLAATSIDSLQRKIGD